MRKIAIASMVLLSLGNYAAAQECSALLSRGIYDIRSSESDLATASSFASWFCDQKFSSSEQANKFGGSIGLPFKALPIKLGFDSSKQSWSQWYSNFCSQSQQSETLQSKVREHVKTINSEIVKGFNECISSQGLHVWLERTHDPKTFRFAAKFNPPNADVGAATIRTFDPGDNVKCKERPNRIDAAGWRTRCTRQDNTAVSFTVTANWPPHGGGNLALPAIAPPAPPAPIAPCTKLGGKSGTACVLCQATISQPLTLAVGASYPFACVGTEPNAKYKAVIKASVRSADIDRREGGHVNAAIMIVNGLDENAKIEAWSKQKFLWKQLEYAHEWNETTYYTNQYTEISGTAVHLDLMAKSCDQGGRQLSACIFSNIRWSICMEGVECDVP